MAARAIPPKLQTAAGVLVASGAIDCFASATLVSIALSVAGSVVGVVLGAVGCPCGGAFALCGLWGFALLPLGMLEVGCGAMGFVNPDGAGPFLRVGNLLQLGSGLFGGLAGVIGGVVVRNLLADPEVVAFLAEPGG